MLPRCLHTCALGRATVPTRNSKGRVEVSHVVQKWNRLFFQLVGSLFVHNRPPRLRIMAVLSTDCVCAAYRSPFCRRLVRSSGPNSPWLLGRVDDVMLVLLEQREEL